MVTGHCCCGVPTTSCLYIHSDCVLTPCQEASRAARNVGREQTCAPKIRTFGGEKWVSGAEHLHFPHRQCNRHARPWTMTTGHISASQHRHQAFPSALQPQLPKPNTSQHQRDPDQSQEGSHTHFRITSIIRLSNSSPLCPLLHKGKDEGCSFLFMPREIWGPLLLYLHKARLHLLSSPLS